MLLAKEIRDTKVEKGELAIFWLGQAGFVLKNHTGCLVAVDPYLTNCGEEIRGFKRLSPMLIEPTEFEPNYFITTHTHFDHFDYEAIPIVAEHSDAVFIGPESCMKELQKLNIDKKRCKRLVTGDSFETEDFKLHAMKCDHGTMAPDAIGLLIEMEGHRIYFSGDTSFHPEWCEEIAKEKPQVAVLSINGEFGNMTAEEGAKAAEILGVYMAIPCHFWTFTEHGGAPQIFCDRLKESSHCRSMCMRQGEKILLQNK